jgi:hypothetical protein
MVLIPIFTLFDPIGAFLSYYITFIL